MVSNALESLSLSESTKSNGLSYGAGEDISLDSCDMQLSPDLASILYSFNNLIEQSMYHGNLMRSASSAGETITRSNQDIQISMPKRAETFNGASSSKESQIQSININADLLKSRVYKNAMSAGCINGLDAIGGYNINSLIIGEQQAKMINGVGTTLSTNSNGSDGAVSHSHTNSDLSADSGYQSRLCVDLSHDIDGENCSCSFYENNQIINSLSNSKNRMHIHTHNGLAGLTKKQQQQLHNTQLPMPPLSTLPTRIALAHFESIIKNVYNDYLRLKTENENLKKELDDKNKSIDLLKASMNEIRVN
jgi:hypothetical protein